MIVVLGSPLGVVHRLAFSLGIADHLELLVEPLLSLVGAATG